MFSMRHWAYITIIFTIALIVVPSLIGVVILLQLAQEITTSQIINALSSVMNSLVVASLVTIINILVSIPFAWRIARKNDSLSKFLDFILDAPLFVPTAALGFSVLSFWSSGYYSLNLISPGFWLVVLLHFTFTHPYIVRTLIGVIRSTDLSVEVAAKSFGIKRAVLSRTIYLPMLKAGIIAGALISFARSISETGATYVVAGPFETGPVFIKNRLSVDPGSAAFAAVSLLLASIFIFSIIRRISRRRFLPLHPETKIEKMIGLKMAFSINIISLLFFAVMILIPSFYLVAYLSPGATCDWASLTNSLLLSTIIALAVSIIDLFFGIPLAYYLARADSLLRDLVEALVIVPLIVPTVSLGTSLGYFWGSFGLNPVIAIAFAHLSFTFPIFVMSYTAAIESIDPELELVAQSLGADTIKTYREITLQLTKSAIASSAVLVFTRSFGETGATISVAEAMAAEIYTLPLLLVSWIKKAQAGLIPFSTVAIASFITLIIGLLMMAVIKMAGGKRGKYE
ncbi:MAG: ABC transporter permease [Candidatus Njordarchaeales archaeon]